MFTQATRKAFRIRAISTLVTLGGASLAVLLTVAFPNFGVPASFNGFLYIPPQAYLASLLAPVTLGFAIATGTGGLAHSTQSRQREWAVVFVLLLVLLVLGPTYLICSFALGWSAFPNLPGTPQSLSWQANDWWYLAAGSAVVIALTAVCALVYLRRWN
jgi:hypothetical protein